MTIIKRTDTLGNVQFLQHVSVTKLVFVTNKHHATKFPDMDADRLVKWYRKNKGEGYEYNSLIGQTQQ